MKQPFLLSAAVILISIAPQLALGEKGNTEDLYEQAYEACAQKTNETVIFDDEDYETTQEEWDAAFNTCMTEQGFTVPSYETPDEDIMDSQEGGEEELEGDWTLQ